MTQRMPALFLGHGSPMTTITDNAEVRALRALGPALPTPRAILAITAHWETHGKTHLTVGERPRTIHDFRGFPQELYDIRYAAPGADWLVDRVGELLGEERIARDDTWGFDHGAWGVVLPMFPAADVPLVAMSLDRSLTPAEHFALGQRLAPLRDEGVLIVGSGNVIHNLALWRGAQGTQPPWALTFREGINAALLADNRQALIAAAEARDEPSALAVNSGEHFIPLLYVAGARMADEEVAIFNDTLEGALSMTSAVVGERAAEFAPLVDHRG